MADASRIPARRGETAQQEPHSYQVHVVVHAVPLVASSHAAERVRADACNGSQQGAWLVEGH